MTVPYEPPVQSKRGQLLDAATVLVLIFATLFVTTFLIEDAETGTAATAPESRTLEDLPLTEVEQAQYQKVIDSGTADLPAVVAAVDANRAGEDKYDVSVAALLGTAALLAVYLAFVYRTSFHEYREVIEERFGPREGGGSE